VRLSIVIVSYNTKDKLRMTLRSVFDSNFDFEFEVFAVDNHSSDGSAAMVRAEFPRVLLIENSKNSGYAKANNQAIRKARGKYVLLLNSDVAVSPSAFDTMVKFMDNNPEAGIAGCKVLREDGRLDSACRRSFPTPWVAFSRFSGLQSVFPKSRFFARYHLTFLPENELSEVDSVMGAFLLIRRDVIGKIGLLDEDYFMYGEDIDWCYRAKQAGYKVFYVPTAAAVHYKGSSSKRSSKKALFEFHNSMRIFYDKHYKDRYSRFTRFVVMAAIWKMYFLRAFRNFFKAEKLVSK